MRGAKPIHEDLPFGHVKHVVLIILTWGLWTPVWLIRWQMHKTDRVREALYELALEVAELRRERTA